MKNYSQNDEQEVIVKYFGGFKGTFIEIGANDGVTLSNTRALAELGWRGAFVEASPKAFHRLVINYDGFRGMEFHHVALSDHDGVITLNESGALLGADDTSLVSTVHEHEMKRFDKVVKYEQIEIKCVSWDTFFHKTEFDHFDFISLDIEGSELEVLPDIDLSGTKLICIEHNGREDLKAEYEKYLEGFKLIHVTGENLLYAR